MILLLFCSCWSFGQNPLIEKTIKKIDFQEDTIKSVFDWITDNIDYDVKLLRKVTKQADPKMAESPDQRIKDVLKSKKGVCQHYSELFDAIVSQLGYESFVVTGYIKREGVGVDTEFGHAWNAVKFRGKWRLYDATWGAGGVRNGKKYVKKYKPQWLDVAPKEMIKTHIPFDPMWQLLEQPISFAQFDKDDLTSQYEESYDFEAQIQKHLSTDLQTEGTLQRIDEFNQDKKYNKLVAHRVELMKKRIEVKKKNVEVMKTRGEVAKYNDLSKIMRENTNLFNEYITAKNKKFVGKKWTPDFCKKTMKDIQQNVQNVLDGFKAIKVEDPKLKNSLKTTIKRAEGFYERVTKENAFLEERFK